MQQEEAIIEGSVLKKKKKKKGNEGEQTRYALSLRPNKVVNQNACFLSGNIKDSQKRKTPRNIAREIGIVREIERADQNNPGKNVIGRVVKVNATQYALL